MDLITSLPPPNQTGFDAIFVVVNDRQNHPCISHLTTVTAPQLARLSVRDVVRVVDLPLPSSAIEIRDSPHPFGLNCGGYTAPP